MNKLVQADIVPSYACFLRGRMNTEEYARFIQIFNRLIIEKWSNAGLKRIKQQAWKHQVAIK